MKILLAYDGSSYSDVAAAEISRRPWPPNSEVRVLTVDPPLDSSIVRGALPTAFDALVLQQRTTALQNLNTAADRIKGAAPHLIVTPMLREGYPKEVILEEAERWGADLIVVGSQGLGAMRRFFLGSVSLAIATNAPCSVEIVRHPAVTEPITV